MPASAFGFIGRRVLQALSHWGIKLPREQEAAVPVVDLCRKHGLSSPAFYKWKAKFGGMEVSEARGGDLTDADVAYP